MDPVKAAFNRSATRFAEAAGIPQEATMAANAQEKLSTKTAGAGAENDMKGSQLQTAEDKGDYDAASAQVAKQKAETAQSAADSTPENGAQLHSVNFKDQSYSQSGGGGEARLAVVKTVAALAGVDPAAAAKFMRMAEGTGDVGAPMGGTPDEVAQGDKAMEGEETPAPAPEAPAGPSADQAAQVKLNDVIKEQDQALEIDKAVNDKLKEIAKEVGASIRLPYLGLGKVTAWYQDGFAAKFASVEQTIRFRTKKANPGATTPAQPASAKPTGKQSPAMEPSTEKLPTTDKLVAMKTKIRHPAHGVGTVTAIRGDKVAITFPNDVTVMMPKSAIERGDEGGETKLDALGNDKVPHAAVDPKDLHQSDGDPDWSLYDQSRETTKSTSDSTSGQTYSPSGDKDYQLTAQKAKLTQAQNVLRKQVNELMTKGMSTEAAVARVAGSKLGQSVAAAVKKLKSIEAQLKAGKADIELTEEADKEKAKKDKEKDAARRRQAAGSPAEQKASDSDDTTRYEKSEQGDTGDDAISKGSDTSLESPETAATVSQARGEFDKRHNDSVKGSTVANFSQEERTKSVAHLKKMDQTHDGLVATLKQVSPLVVTHRGKGAVVAVVKELAADIKIQGDLIEACLKSNSTAKQAVRSKLADAVVAGRLLMKSARQQVALLGTLAKEADHHRSRFARVSPAFKLAATQFQAGLIGGEELAPKVAEYINLDANSFGVLSKNVQETIYKMANRRPGSKTAKRLPFVGTDGPVGPHASMGDDLDGIFDD